MDVARLALIKGVHTPQGAALFQTLMAATSWIIDIDESVVLDMAGKRLPQGRNDQHDGEVLAHVDEAIGVIDQTDRRGFRDENEAAVAEKEVLDSFVLEVQSKRVEVEETFPKRKKAKETKPMLPNMVTQVEAKPFIPPKSYTWIASYKNEWHGHLEPYKRVSATWEGDSLEDEVAACHAVIRTLWRQDLESRRKPTDHCPVAGVFDCEMA